MIREIYYCPYCGTEIANEKAKVCLNCGHLLTSTATVNNNDKNRKTALIITAIVAVTAIICTLILSNGSCSGRDSSTETQESSAPASGDLEGSNSVSSQEELAPLSEETPVDSTETSSLSAISSTPATPRESSHHSREATTDRHSHHNRSQNQQINQTRGGSGEAVDDQMLNDLRGRGNTTGNTTTSSAPTLDEQLNQLRGRDE